MSITIHVIITILSFLLMYADADHTNEMNDLKEDKYLPRRYRRLNKLFYFSRYPIRFWAYVQEICALIFLYTYIVIMLSGRVITGSYDFVLNSLFRYYPLLMFGSGPILACVKWIYIFCRIIRERLGKKSKDK